MANLVTIGNSVLCNESVDWSAKALPYMALRESSHAYKSITNVEVCDGFEVRTELYDGDEFGCEDFEVNSAYSSAGIYLGDKRTAEFIVTKKGIKPQLADPGHAIASIGFQKEECKWYGWSHRAICGFTLGDRIFDENYRSDLSDAMRGRIPFIKHGDRTIATLDEAQLSAKNFGNYVS